MASKQQQCFRMCVHPCPRYLTGGDTHVLCVACLGEEHARSALESTAMCFPCGHSNPTWRSFAMRTLRLAFPRAPVPLLLRHSKGCSPGVHKWMGTALSLPSPDRFSVSSQCWEACVAVSSAPTELSDSEELNVVSANARDSEDSPPQSRAYEELVEFVTRVVEKLSIDWTAEREDVRSKGKLDECFLPPRAQPQCRGLPFFPDLHTEVSRSWERPVSYRVYSTQTSHYSSILNQNEHNYGEMPKGGCTPNEKRSVASRHVFKIRTHCFHCLVCDTSSYPRRSAALHIRCATPLRWKRRS